MGDILRRNMIVTVFNLSAKLLDTGGAGQVLSSSPRLMRELDTVFWPPNGFFFAGR